MYHDTSSSVLFNERAFVEGSCAHHCTTNAHLNKTFLFKSGFHMFLENISQIFHGDIKMASKFLAVLYIGD